MSTNNIKAQAFDWLFKSLIALVAWLIVDMKNDVKMIIQTLPAMKVEIENLKQNRFAVSQPIIYKHEDFITLDTLKNKNNP